MASDTVAGYFANGEDAHRAISALMESGFTASEIGAAFHSHSGRGTRESAEAIEEENAPMQSPVNAQTTAAGPASDTNAVTPQGLSTGGGSVIAGASRPGPIPGSEIPDTLPRSIPSELSSKASPGKTSRVQPEWQHRLRDVFPANTPKTATDKSSMNFGTGEGYLDLNGAAYSSSAFEGAFAGMGIPPEHARRIARELGRGGAVVTVKAGSKNEQAAALLEKNGGVIRYEPAFAVKDEAWQDEEPEAQVEMFGEVRRVFPGSMRPDQETRRKAS